MKKQKQMLAILLAGTMTASLAACGNGGNADTNTKNSSSDEKVTLNVLFNNTDENVEAEMAYVTEHLPEVLPDVNVELEMVSGDAETYETKVRTMISAGGEGIDVWWERGGSWATPVSYTHLTLPTT